MKSEQAKEILKQGVVDFYPEDTEEPLYVSLPDAEDAVDTAEDEMKEKCCIAFRNFMLRVTLASIAGEQLDFEKEFEKTMSLI